MRLLAKARRVLPSIQLTLALVLLQWCSVLVVGRTDRAARADATCALCEQGAGPGELRVVVDFGAGQPPALLWISVLRAVGHINPSLMHPCRARRRVRGAGWNGSDLSGEAVGVQLHLVEARRPVLGRPRSLEPVDPQEAAPARGKGKRVLRAAGATGSALVPRHHWYTLQDRK